MRKSLAQSHIVLIWRLIPTSISVSKYSKVQFQSQSCFNPIPRGGRIYAPPTTFRPFSPDVLIQGGSNYTQNLSYVITEHIKLVPGQKSFPTARGSPSKSGGQLIFCSVFASKLVVILLSMKIDEFFLMKSNVTDRKCYSKITKLALNFNFQKDLEVQLQNLTNCFKS